MLVGQMLAMIQRIHDVVREIALLSNLASSVHAASPVISRERTVARECARMRAARTHATVRQPGGPSTRQALAVRAAVGDNFSSRVVLTRTKTSGGSDWSRPVSSIEMHASNRQQRAKLWPASLRQGSETDGDHLASTHSRAA